MKKIKHINFILTHRCNLNCAYCLRQAGNNRSEMDFETIKTIINTVEFADAKNCTLTGGEAALHSKFWEIISLLGEQGFSVTIESNGLIVNEQWLNKLLEKIDRARLKFLISIDHYDERVHDAFRGKGKHKQAGEAIKILKNKKIIVSTNSVIHRQNFFSRLELYKFFDYLCKLKVDKTNFSPVVSIGNNQNDKYSLTKYECALAEEIIRELRNIFRGRIEVAGYNNKPGATCDRINIGNIVASYKGFHPCLYLDDIIVKNLKEGIQEDYHYNESLCHLKKAIDIAQENNTNACWSCCKSFQEFGANPPFRVQIE